MKTKINISIDDVSPHPKSSVKVLDRCFELIDLYRDIKISLFVPLAYWRTCRKDTSTPMPLNISNYPDFCEILKKLPKENFEICYHGYYHGIPHSSDNDEFRDLSYTETKEKINNMFTEVRNSGLEDTFQKIFRPPAWRLSKESFKAMNEEGFKLFALTDLDYAMAYYSGEEKVYPSTFSNQFPPFTGLYEEEKCGIVYHACEWDKNYLNKEKTTELINFIDGCKNKSFEFLGELV